MNRDTKISKSARKRAEAIRKYKYLRRQIAYAECIGNLENAEALGLQALALERAYNL